MTTKLVSERLKLGWCQGVSAKDKQRALVSPTSHEAVAWCFTGAIKAGYWETDDPSDLLLCGEQAEVFVKELWPLDEPVVEAFEWLPAWNDDAERTQAEVIEMAIMVEAALGLAP